MQCHNYNNNVHVMRAPWLVTSKLGLSLIIYIAAIVSPQTTPTFPISVTFNIATLQLFSWH